jgi:hypothetical protein
MECQQAQPGTLVLILFGKYTDAKVVDIQPKRESSPINNRRLEFYTPLTLFFNFATTRGGMSRVV